jgi:hypothetical protein
MHTLIKQKLKDLIHFYTNLLNLYGEKQYFDVLHGVTYKSKRPEPNKISLVAHIL